MEVIFNEMEVTLTMQCASLLKQQNSQQSQQQQPEYGEQDIHKDIVTSTSNSDGTDLMEIKSNVSNKVYSLHLEFTEDATGIGQEIRDTLKEKYLHQKLKLGSMQIEPNMLQCTSQEGEKEEQGA